MGLHRRGLTQHVVSLRGRGPYADDLEAAGIPVSAFDVVSAPRALAVLWSLRQLVRRIEPDIIQGWMYHGDLAALAAHLVAGRRSRRRLCWNIRASNMDDTRYARLLRICGLFSRWPDVVVANSEAERVSTPRMATGRAALS